MADGFICFTELNWETEKETERQRLRQRPGVCMVGGAVAPTLQRTVVCAFKAALRPRLASTAATAIASS